MKAVYSALPVYAGDVSGACGALYELGGMTVMHDPSGCNSTYNTFDETRWYDKESLIFLSGLTDRDAALGDDRRLIRDVEETARTMKPSFVALVNSPLPYLNGTDFAGICRLLERDLDIPAFYVPTNGMHDYTAGASGAFLRVAERLTDPLPGGERDGVNILGMTPLDFAAPDAAARLGEILAEGGFRVVSNWALDTDLESVRRAGAAAVNLVVSSAGLAAAEYLQRVFGTPYVTGIPTGAFAGTVLEALREAARTGISRRPQVTRRLTGPAEWTLIGEPVVMGSLAAALEQETGRPARVLCPTEITGGLLGENDRAVRGEQALREALSGAGHILADPLYKAVCPPGAEFLPLPHLAFSGRMYRRRYPDLFSGALTMIDGR